MRLYLVSFTRPDTGKREVMPFSIKAVADKVAARLRERGVGVEVRVI